MLHPHTFIFVKGIQVVICILALGKQAWFVSDYNGPCIGRPDISQISIETVICVASVSLW